MIKFIFIIVLLYALRLYFRPQQTSKQLALGRISVLFIILGGIYLVIDPNVASKIANYLGVGRGTDLVFYFSVLGGIILFIKQVKTTNALRADMLKLNREIAVLKAEKKKRSLG